MTRLALPGMALALLTAPAATAQQWAPPEGCDGFLTVQMRGCFVTNFWRCDEAPEGYVYRASHDDEGALVAAASDGDGNWVDTVFADGWRERLLYPVADPIASGTLLASGMDAYDFETLTNAEDSDAQVVRTRIRGVDMLTGKSTTVDGVELLEIAYLQTYAGVDGVVFSHGSGHRYYSPDHGLYLPGRDEWDDDGSVTSYDNTPVAFIAPEEPGFGSVVPVHDCDEAASAEAEATPLPVEDDDIGSMPPKGSGTKDEDGAKSR